MNSGGLSTLVLSLGNDIMGDDKVGLTVGQILKKQSTKDVDFIESGEAGLAMLDIMSGYDRVLLLDSVVTGCHPPGTVLEFLREDFDKVTGPSPHYAGLPEVLGLAKCLGEAFPEEIRVLAMEIESPYEFKETLSDVIEQAIPAYVNKANRILQQWKEKDARNFANTKSAGGHSAANQSS